MQEHKTVPPEEDDAHNLIQEEATKILSSRQTGHSQVRASVEPSDSLFSRQIRFVKISIFTTKELSGFSLIIKSLIYTTTTYNSA